MSDLDLTPEAVDRLASDLQSVAAATGPNDAAAIAWSAAATLRALSARAEAAEETVGILQATREALETHIADLQRELARALGLGPTARAEAPEAALATARAGALREAAAVAEKTGTRLLPSGSFLSERCRDAILALIPKEQTNDR